MLDRLKIWWDDLLQGKPTKANNGKSRSPKWPAARKAHLKLQPCCQWCGSKVKLQVHHKQPFHIHPELELEPSNFITLCEQPKATGDSYDCHYEHGHLGMGWDKFNPYVQEQCDARTKRP